MKASLIEKILLKDLLKSSNGLLDYTFYQRYRVLPADMYKFIEKYSKLELLNYAESRITLTEKGKIFLLSKKFELGDSGDKFKKIPERFLAPKLPINEFYIPKKFILR
jgi:hypothetical protein